MLPNKFSTYPVYEGNDLGLVYTQAYSTFRIWSPPATAAEIIFYQSGTGGSPLMVYGMNSGTGGTWYLRVDGDLVNRYYSFRVLIDGKWSEEVVDPYARFAGVNSKRAQVAAPEASDPEGWMAEQLFFQKDEKKGNGTSGRDPAGVVIYEMHIRDMTVHETSGIAGRGKFLGLTERGTVNKQGLSTGLDHLVELGVTHVQLLPVFDFHSVDESEPERPAYNWGYDPMLFQTPEGSYASDARDGRVRVREFKEMVMAFHRAGLKLIMDMALNHTALTEDSSFNVLVPGYYYRQLPDGNFSNASGCGNETASERPMMRKFMIDTLKYWVEAFHVDGFRIDLMGVHDIQTMNIISRELRAIRPDILLYGEGWSAKPSPFPEPELAVKKNVQELHHIAVFGDEFRDGIRGSVFFNHEKGFVSGCAGLATSVKFGITACCPHPQLNYSLVNYADAPYAANPLQVISYCECHDNLNLWDKLVASAMDAGWQQRKNMHLLAISIVLTSQGIAFLHAGSEFLRSKQGVDNSFNSGDEINAIDWSMKSVHRDVFEYTRYLIRLRRAHPMFRMTSGNMVAENIFFIDSPEGVITYSINGKASGDEWDEALLVFNGSEKIYHVDLPARHWEAAVINNRQSSEATEENFSSVNSHSCTILYR